ncbi:nucleotidyltransferase domain protein [bacterium BMS3Bbin06]|nr:nucleotidyltransferase domain protein [bacterium BMS3Abin08]GBE35067.1 nucleotidyltransferase domain protein [bacterium BMS3Bbin06]
MSKNLISENRNTRTIKTLEEINAILKEHKEELRKRYRIKEIGVFGSYVRGEQKKRGSDVDILVEFDELPDIFMFIDLEDHLSRLLRKKVDLVRKGAIRPELKDIIFNETVYI